MENKVDKIKKFLKEQMAELNYYVYNGYCDECEKNDCKVLLQEYECILNYINNL